MKLLIYFADGLSWQYCEKTEFMEDFWPARKPLETILGYSSAIIPCLLSGRSPEQTGIWTEYYYSPRQPTKIESLLASSPILLTPANLVRLVAFRVARLRGVPAAHRLRIPLQFAHLFRRHDIDYHRFPPIDLPVPMLDDVFRENNLRFEVIHMKEHYDVDDEITRLKSMLDEIDVFFYFDHFPDAQGHKVGTSVAGLKPTIDRIGQFVERAWNHLGPEEDRELVLFSDHGMADVTATFDLVRHIRKFKLGADYLTFMDSTFARFWFLVPEKRQLLVDAMADAPGHFLSPEETAQYGLSFENSRYGEAIWVAHEGVVIHPNYISPTFLRTKNSLVGMHGYAPTDPSSYGIFAYRGSRWTNSVPDPMPALKVFNLISGIVEREPPLQVSSD